MSTQFPTLMDILLGLLHRELVVSLPISFVLHDNNGGAGGAGGLTPAQHRRLMGFKEIDDPNASGGGGGGGGGKVFESIDEVLKRTEGLMLLYGAIVQVRKFERCPFFLRRIL